MSATEYQESAVSTQNQAFNAILFLFCNVLGKETGDLSSTVRAQRGQKLPVVFSVEEVKGLFAHMTGKSFLIAELRKYVHSQSAFCL